MLKNSTWMDRMLLRKSSERVIYVPLASFSPWSEEEKSRHEVIMQNKWGRSLSKNIIMQRKTRVLNDSLKSALSRK